MEVGIVAQITRGDHEVEALVVFDVEGRGGRAVGALDGEGELTGIGEAILGNEPVAGIGDGETADVGAGPAAVGSGRRIVLVVGRCVVDLDGSRGPADGGPAAECGGED